MSNIKTVPNQKIIKVNKEICGKGNLYAAINLEAMERAAQDLDAACFKLWIYFAKNQNNYEFALSSKAIADSFGMKKDQYDRAIKVLLDKHYLIQEKGNQYSFHEIALVGNNHNENVLQAEKGEKTTTALQEKTTTQLQENPIRNNINNTIYNTTTAAAHKCALPTQEQEAKEGVFVAQEEKPKPLTERERWAAFMGQW